MEDRTTGWAQLFPVSDQVFYWLSRLRTAKYPDQITDVEPGFSACPVWKDFVVDCMHFLRAEHSCNNCPHIEVPK